MGRKVTGVVRFVIVCMIVLISCASYSDVPKERGNVFGVVSMIGVSDSTAMSIYLDYLHDLVGDWGLAAKAYDVPASFEDVEKIIVTYRAKKIIPMFHVGPPPTGSQPGSDGTFKEAAKVYGEWFAEARRRQLPILYVELMNEVNCDSNWPPEKYARWLYDFAKEIHAVYPEVKVCSSGMAGSGADYYDKMLTAMPELKEVVDVWNLHPYCANHPPDYMKDDCSMAAHKWTAKVLQKHGIKEPKFILSELGYELGDRRDTNYPPIDEYNRAAYIVDGFIQHYINDERVLAACPFTLWDPNQSWDGGDLIKYDRTPTPMYNALKELPKKGGKDWLPRGKAVIKGKIVDGELGVPVERVFVCTFPGYYAAETNNLGEYVIEGVPVGKYKIRCLKDGYISSGEKEIEVVSEDGIYIYNEAMKRVGLIPGGMDVAGDGGTVPAGWITLDGQPHYGILRIDKEVKRSGSGSQRMRIIPDGWKPAIWCCGRYNDAIKDWVYALEVWVKTENLVIGKGKGVVISLQICNNGGEPIVNHTVVDASTGTTDWHPITLSLVCPAEGRRTRVDIGVDAESGFVWIDDVFLHYANLPLPSDYELWRRGKDEEKRGIVLGFIKDNLGRPMKNVTLCTQPGNYYAVSDKNGFYSIKEIPHGKYVLRVCPMGEFESKEKKIEISSKREIVREDFIFGRELKPGEVRNPSFEEHGMEPKYTPHWEKWGSIDGILEEGKTIFSHVRAHSGKYFLHAGAGSTTKNGGVYQLVGVEPNKKYRLSAWIQTAQEGGEKGETAVRIGIDPFGDEDPKSRNIVWSKYEFSENEWKQISVEAVAEQPVITIFIELRQLRPNLWNANWVDDVELQRIE
jgi:hypothetical protein